MGRVLYLLHFISSASARAERAGHVTSHTRLFTQLHGTIVTPSVGMIAFFAVYALD